MIEDAEIITHNGVDLLVFPTDNGKSPTLKFIEIGTVTSEFYKDVYKKYLDEKYNGIS